MSEAPTSQRLRAAAHEGLRLARQASFRVRDAYSEPPEWLRSRLPDVTTDEYGHPAHPWLIVRRVTCDALGHRRQEIARDRFGTVWHCRRCDANGAEYTDAVNDIAGEDLIEMLADRAVAQDPRTS